MPSAYFKRWAPGFRKRINLTKYWRYSPRAEPVPVGMRFRIGHHFRRSSGIRHNPSYRDRVTQKPVTERYEIHDINGYDA